MATIKRATKSVSTPPLIAFSFAPVRSVSLCNIRARRCLIDHALLQGGREGGGGRSVWRSFSFRSVVRSLILEIPSRDSTTVTTFCLFISPRRIAPHFRAHITLSRWVNAKVVVCEWTWIQEEREKLSRSSVCLSYSSRILSRPFEVCMTDCIHTRVFVRFCWTTSFLRELRWEFSSFVRNYHRIRIFFFFFFLCCRALRSCCFTLCNRENDCESRITVEFKLWIRKRGKKK